MYNHAEKVSPKTQDRASAEHKYHLAYRSDIEGLRAVAILLVVAAHAQVTWLAGGFVGVDVFFVLSGYLITGLLTQEIFSSHRLNYVMFYSRRLLRLLPALLLMLCLTSLLAWLLFPLSEQPDQATAAASATWWASNLYFAFAQLDYFSPAAETNLFLHTWSLGVEEQFYLIWPIFLMLSLGLWGRSVRQPKLWQLKKLLLLVLGCSLVAEILWTRSAAHLAFYFMPARAWQFALGALMFLSFAEQTAATGNIAKVANRIYLSRWGGWLGLLLIGTAALILDNQTPYPGVWALLPSIGAALVLVAGIAPSRMGANKSLSWRPLQAIGRVSYSWYLWHWPVLLLGGLVLSRFNNVSKLGLVLLSLLIASLSYRYVESPIRQNRWLATRPVAATLGALGLMIIVVSLAFYWRHISGNQLSQPDQVRYAQARFDAPVIYSMGCDDHFYSANIRTCSFGTAHAPHTVVLVGDSIGLQWFPAIAPIFNRPDWQLLVLTKSACPMVDAPIFYARIGREYSECADWRQKALQKIREVKPDIVIAGSTDTYDYSQAQWTDGTTRILQSLSSSAKHVYLLRSTPELPFDGPSCLAPRSWSHAAAANPSACTGPAGTAHGGEIFHWQAEAARHFANVSLIDMTDAVCPDGECKAELRGVIVFRDTHHLTATFATSLSSNLRSRIQISP